MPDWRDLTPAQIEGATFIASRPVSMLADVPGLGKTAQLVHACDMIGARRVIVICPPILRDNIAREFERWSILDRPVTVIRTGRDTLPDTGVIAISYNLAVTKRDELRLWRCDLLACDEAHALKETSAARTKAVLSAHGIARGAARMLWMTGTPAPNNAGELYTFAKASGVWHGNRSAFLSSFCTTVSTMYGEKITGNRDPDGLKRMLAPVMIRRTVVEGLPPLRLSTLPVPGDSRAVRELSALIDDETRALIEAAHITGDYSFLDAAFVSTIRRLAGIAKAPAVADLVTSELAGGEPKVLLFAQHTAVIDSIRDALSAKGYYCPILDGRTPVSKRQGIIDAFERGDDVRVLLCQTQSASEGLTFVRGSRVIIAEPAWSPKDNSQMIHRVWRKGQKREVRASMCTLHGSIDDAIVKTLERKQKMIDEIL